MAAGSGYVCCFHCSSALTPSEKMASDAITCPSCGQPFISLTSESSTLPETQIVLFRCPSCGAADERLARHCGEAVPCWSCGAEALLPPLPGSPPTVLPEAPGPLAPPPPPGLAPGPVEVTV